MNNFFSLEPPFPFERVGIGLCFPTFSPLKWLDFFFRPPTTSLMELVDNVQFFIPIIISFGIDKHFFQCLTTFVIKMNEPFPKILLLRPYIRHVNLCI